MELTVTQENLSKALSSVGRVASSRTQLPILNNILLRTDGNQLLVAAMNMEVSSMQYIGAKIAKPGGITVPARLATDFIASIPKDTVTLTVTGDHLHIVSGSYSSVINGITADDYPELPLIDESVAIGYSIALPDFKQAVSQTIITSSNDAARPVLTGVYWHSHEGSLYLAATDGYRLSERKLVDTKSDVAAIIPTTTLQEVLRSLSDDVAEVAIFIDESQVKFRIGDAEIISQLIDGNFPDYRKLIPSSSSVTATLSKDEFVRVTKVAGLFARDSGGGITITVDDDAKTLSMHSIASELGENTSEVTVKADGKGSVTLNSRYLSEALSVIDGSTIEFGFSGKLAACVVRSTEHSDNYQHIVMPLKS